MLLNKAGASSTVVFLTEEERLYGKPDHSFKLVFYEIYETLRFNQLIDISEFIHDKEKIIMNYKRSLYDKPELYVHGSLGLNAQKSIFTQNKGYYEAFIVVDQPIDAERIYDWSCYRSDDLS